MIKNFIVNFWYGKIPLWKSYWIIGELINTVFILLIYNIEIRFFCEFKLLPKYYKVLNEHQDKIVANYLKSARNTQIKYKNLFCEFRVLFRYPSLFTR